MQNATKNLGTLKQQNPKSRQSILQTPRQAIDENLWALGRQLLQSLNERVRLTNVSSTVFVRITNCVTGRADLFVKFASVTVCRVMAVMVFVCQTDLHSPGKK